MFANDQKFPDFETEINTEKYLWLLHVQYISSFPPNLQILDLSSCHEIKILPELPNTLKELKISFCSNLLKLPKLPDSLEILVSTWDNFTVFPLLPKNLKLLSCSGCPIKTLQLPHNLAFLRCSDTEISELVLSPNLVEVACDSCLSLEKISGYSPKLSLLNCQDCPELQILPQFSNSLQTLRCDISMLHRTVDFFTELMKKSIDCLYIENMVKNKAFQEECKHHGINLLELKKDIQACKKNRFSTVHQVLRDLPTNLENLVGSYSYDYHPSFRADFKRSRSKNKKKASKHKSNIKKSK